MFEGIAYDLLAALIGALLGAGVAYAMVVVMAKAFSSEGFAIEFAITARSLVIAYALGVVLTLAVVALSALRVSRMTVAAALRNLPDPVASTRRRRVVVTLGVIGLGLLLALSGASASQATR